MRNALLAVGIGVIVLVAAACTDPGAGGSPGATTPLETFPAESMPAESLPVESMPVESPSAS